MRVLQQKREQLKKGPKGLGRRIAVTGWEKAESCAWPLC